MLAFDDEVVLGAIHPSPLRNIFGLGATPLESTLLTLMLSCFVDKAYSFDEVVRVEVVLWRLWVWVVEMKRALRVRCLGLGPVYLYPYRWLKHHLLALKFVWMCPVVATAIERHCLCTPFWLVSYANQSDSSLDSTTFVPGSRVPPWYLQASHKSVPATHV